MTFSYIPIAGLPRHFRCGWEVARAGRERLRKRRVESYRYATDDALRFITKKKCLISIVDYVLDWCDRTSHRAKITVQGASDTLVKLCSVINRFNFQRQEQNVLNLKS